MASIIIARSLAKSVRDIGSRGKSIQFGGSLHSRVRYLHERIREKAAIHASLDLAHIENQCRGMDEPLRRLVGRGFRAGVTIRLQHRRELRIDQNERDIRLSVCVAVTMVVALQSFDQEVIDREPDGTTPVGVASKQVRISFARPIVDSVFVITNAKKVRFFPVDRRN